MAKTLVVAAHEIGPAINGHDGCHARWAEGGICPGAKMAAWLNGLGDDDETFTVLNKVPITNGNVRDNYLRSYAHVVAKDPQLARLRAEQRDLSARLRQVQAKIKETEQVA